MKNLSSLISHLSSRNSQQGQALLVAVLVMVVALTVGLSVASRSITNLRTSTEEANSQKAFSAAEAGIEQALKSEQTGKIISESNKVNLANNATITETNITSIGGTNFTYNGDKLLAQDDGADIWFSKEDYTWPNSTYPSTAEFFTIYWGSSLDSCAANTAAAIEVIVLSGTSKASAETKRFAYDPCLGSRSPANGFTGAETGSYTVGGKPFKYRTPNDFLRSINNIFFVRVIPLYVATPLGVNTCNPGGRNCTILPQQGKQIDATGVAGGTTRKITYFQGPAKVPSEFFPYIIFSP